MRGAIVALARNGVIGVAGQLPWHYPADLQRFKQITLSSTIIMGRITWDSLGHRALPQRRNIVISQQRRSDVECFDIIEAALAAIEGDTWFIGGAQLYAAALDYCDIVDTTQVPDTVGTEDAVFFPELDPMLWKTGPVSDLPEDPRLKLCRYPRVAP